MEKAVALYCSNCDINYDLEGASDNEVYCPTCKNPLLLQEQTHENNLLNVCQRCSEYLDPNSSACTVCGYSNTNSSDLINSDTSTHLKLNQDDTNKEFQISRRQFILRSSPLLLLFALVAKFPVLMLILPFSLPIYFIATYKSILKPRITALKLAEKSKHLVWVPFIQLFYILYLTITPSVRDKKDWEKHSEDEIKEARNTFLYLIVGCVFMLLMAFMVFSAENGVSTKAILPVALLFKIFGPTIAIAVCFIASGILLVLGIMQKNKWDKMR